MNEIALTIMMALIVPVAIIGAIVYFAVRFIQGRRSPDHNEATWYQVFAFSHEDLLSQLFTVLSYGFLILLLFALDTEFHLPLEPEHILLVSAVMGFAMSYYLRALFVLPFTILVTCGWWIAQTVAWLDQVEEVGEIGIFLGIIFIAIISFMVGRLHATSTHLQRFAYVYHLFGLIVVTIALFFISTKPGMESLSAMTRDFSFTEPLIAGIALVVLVALSCGSAVYAYLRKAASIYEALYGGVLTLLLTVFLVLNHDMFALVTDSELYRTSRELSTAGVVWAVIFNLVILDLFIAFIFQGYIKKSEWYINIGAILLFLLIVVKYFDWFFSFLDKSVFFIGAGVIMLGLGWFMEKGRRKLVSEVREIR